MSLNRFVLRQSYFMACSRRCMEDQFRLFCPWWLSGWWSFQGRFPKMTKWRKSCWNHLLCPLPLNHPFHFFLWIFSPFLGYFWSNSWPVFFNVLGCFLDTLDMDALWNQTLASTKPQMTSFQNTSFSSPISFVSVISLSSVFFGSLIL